MSSITKEKLEAFMADRMSYYMGKTDCNRSGINDSENEKYKTLIDKAIKKSGMLEVDPDKRPKGPGEYDDVNIQTDGFRKTYKQIFKKDSIMGSDFEDYEDLLKAIKSGFDPRLKSLAGGVGAEGGFLLPEQFAEKLLDQALEAEIVRPRAMVFGLSAGKGRTMKIPAFEDLNHATSGVGGVQAKWTSEKAEKDETDPKFRMLELKVNKLICYSKSSDELIQESGIPLSTVIGTAFKNSIIFYGDYAYLQGTGAGQPLGVLNSPALLTQAKESGQTASTINYDNIVGIFSKLAPSSFKSAVWVASISCLPEMMKLSIEVGLAGEHVRILQEQNGKFYLLGKEILFTEKVPALGSAGCLGLYDFGAYGILLKEGITLESSIHEGFRSDLTSWRMILSVDGQPTIANPLTCLDGTTIVSPFVCLGAV